MTETTHRFTIEVEVPDDHDDAADAEWWADAATGALTGYGATLATFHVETGKRCQKCSGPILSPTLDGPERCPLCGDEPASRAELAELLRAALHGGVVAIRDHLEGVPGTWERGAFRALDNALDDIDSAVRYLESDDYRDDDECECEAGVLVDQTYGHTAPPWPEAVMVQRCDLCEVHDGDLTAAVAHAAATGGRVHAIGDRETETMAPLSDVWIMPADNPGPVIWHPTADAVRAGWIVEEEA